MKWYKVIEEETRGESRKNESYENILNLTPEN